MYDRKTWIVLIVCGVLLALGMREQSKLAEQRRLQQEKQRQEQAAKAGGPAASGTAAADNKPALVAEPPPPPAEEVIVKLETPEVVFTFSNIGGGIKFAEFKNQLQVGDNSTPVRINDRGGAPIGGIAGPDAKMENIAYTYDEAASVPGQKVVYVGRLDSGLLARKVFSLVTDGRPGSPYLLDLSLTLENPGTTPFGLKEWSLYAGTAVQQHKDEFAHYIGAFWYQNNNMHFRHAGKFTKGFFSSAKSNIDSDAGDPIQFAGVTDQFFSTVLRPEPPMASTVWSRPGHIPGKSVRAGLRFPDVALNPGDRREFAYQVFIGPKHNPMLRKMGSGWGELMQYGGPVYDWLLVPIMARVLNWALNSIHGLIDGFANSWSWGLSIIILTILLRLAIWPLHSRSTRTMKRMAKLQPEMQ
nr:membrane protein insertase YidC [Akkermansiaceae bacterium]